MNEFQLSISDETSTSLVSGQDTVNSPSDVGNIFVNSWSLIPQKKFLEEVRQEYFHNLEDRFKTRVNRCGQFS